MIGRGGKDRPDGCAPERPGGGGTALLPPPGRRPGTALPDAAGGNGRPAQAAPRRTGRRGGRRRSAVRCRRVHRDGRRVTSGSFLGDPGCAAGWGRCRGWWPTSRRPRRGRRRRRCARGRRSCGGRRRVRSRPSARPTRSGGAGPPPVVPGGQGGRVGVRGWRRAHRWRTTRSSATTAGCQGQQSGGAGLQVAAARPPGPRRRGRSARRPACAGSVTASHATPAPRRPRPSPAPCGRRRSPSSGPSRSGQLLGEQRPCADGAGGEASGEGGRPGRGCGRRRSSRRSALVLVRARTSSRSSSRSWAQPGHGVVDAGRWVARSSGGTALVRRRRHRPSAGVVAGRSPVAAPWPGRGRRRRGRGGRRAPRARPGRRPRGPPAPRSDGVRGRGRRGGVERRRRRRRPSAGVAGVGGRGCGRPARRDRAGAGADRRPPGRDRARTIAGDESRAARRWRARSADGSRSQTIGARPTIGRIPLRRTRACPTGRVEISAGVITGRGRLSSASTATSRVPQRVESSCRSSADLIPPNTIRAPVLPEDRGGAVAAPDLAQLGEGLRGDVEGEVAAAHVGGPVVQRDRPARQRRPRRAGRSSAGRAGPGASGGVHPDLVGDLGGQRADQGVGAAVPADQVQRVAAAGDEARRRRAARGRRGRRRRPRRWWGR